MHPKLLWFVFYGQPPSAHPSHFEVIESLQFPSKALVVE